MKNLFRIGMILALLVIVGSGLMALKIVFSDSPDVNVPSLVGVHMDAALDAVKQAGLVSKVDRVSSTLPEGTVISQWPDAGEAVSKGKVILLKVSQGGERVSIPDVRGLEYGEAVRTLSEAGFKVSGVTRVPDTMKPSGTVIAQNPAAPAMVPTNANLSLLVSDGSGRNKGAVAVPNLSGQKPEEAEEVLRQMDLVPGNRTEVATSAAPAGYVTGTVPRAGAKVPAGSKVNLRIAIEPSIIATPTPDSGTETPYDRPAEPPEGVTTAPVTPGPTDAPRVTVLPTAAPTAEPTQAPKITQTLPKKMAKIRYQVPPLSRAMALKIELADYDGTHVVRETQVKGGEYISLDVPYSGDGRVTIYLGGEFVWQDRFE